jgi:hypothetical protein
MRLALDDGVCEPATLDKMPDFCDAQTGGPAIKRGQGEFLAGDETGGPP